MYSIRQGAQRLTLNSAISLCYSLATQQRNRRDFNHDRWFHKPRSFARTGGVATLAVTMTNRKMFGIIVLPGIAGLLGCQGDHELVGRKIPHVEVRAVSCYGVQLDHAASPEQVAFVALQAIRDYMRAEDEAAREAALSVQLDVCAADEIESRKQLRLTRDEYVYKVVRQWAPTVGHYIASFPTSWDGTSNSLVKRETASGTNGGSNETEILLEVSDPVGNPNAGAVVVVWLVRDKGFWRVTHVGFDLGKRSVHGPSARRNQ